MTLSNIFSLLDSLELMPCTLPCSQPRSSCKKYMPTINTIPISRVTYSGNKTIVWFTDGTKCVVTCSSNDKYDRQTAIAYALVKRLFGKVGRYDEKTKTFIENEIDGNGIGTKLEKIAALGFDQDLEKKELKAKKAAVKAEHEAKQKAEHDAAWKRRVAKRAEDIRLEREASALADRLASEKKLLNESGTMTASEFFAKLSSEKPCCTGSCKSTDDSWKSYIKPNKPFSKFTQEEKREYWRYHNAKRRAAK